MRDNPILSPSWQQLMSFFFLDSCDYYNLCIHVLTLASSVHTLIIHSNFNTPRADVFVYLWLNGRRISCRILSWEGTG